MEKCRGIQSRVKVFPSIQRLHVQAFAMGLDLDPENEKLREALQGVSDDLTGAQLKMVRCAAL